MHETLGFIFTLCIGIFLHYTYDISSQNAFVALFSPVNESVWEHLKLIFFPAFFFSVIEYFYIGKCYCSFLFIKSIATTLSMAFIVGSFYIYSGIIGKSIVWVDILIFILACFILYVYSYFQLKNNRFCSKYYNAYGISIFTILTLLFVLFTIKPPQIPLFMA